MKTIYSILTFVFCGVLSLSAQETRVKNESSVTARTDKMSYYQKRGAEDAQYEITFTAKTKAEEKAFWKEQKEYEKALKEKDRKAYRVYMASKKNTYEAHYEYCDGHCHHGASFYTYAGYYYQPYERPYYERTYSPTSVNTRISVGSPSLRLGL